MNSFSKVDYTKAKFELFAELELLKYPQSMLHDAEKRVSTHTRFTTLLNNPDDVEITPPKISNFEKHDHFDNDYYEPLEDDSS